MKGIHPSFHDSSVYDLVAKIESNDFSRRHKSCTGDIHQLTSPVRQLLPIVAILFVVSINLTSPFSIASPPFTILFVDIQNLLEGRSGASHSGQRPDERFVRDSSFT